VQFIPVPNTASVEMIYEVLGQRCENIFYAKQNSPFSEVTLTDLAEVFVTWFNAYGKQMTHSQCVLSKIVAKDLSSSSGSAIEFIAGLPVAGEITTANPAPLNVTAAVSFGTASRGRSYRGRIYQVALVVTQFAGNQLTTFYRGQLITAYGALVSAVTTAGFTMSVVSRFHNKLPRSTGVATTITSVSVDINTDSQRRRLAGRGQ
jgi:hypothetical protein